MAPPATPAPELLEALADGWLVGATVLDVGCGLGTEAGALAHREWAAVGIDLSAVALGRARAAHPKARFLQAEVRRVLTSQGRLLLRACMISEGQPNGIDEETIATTFGGWRIASAQTGNDRERNATMQAVIVRLECAD